MPKTFRDINLKIPPLEKRNQVVCTFYEDKKVHSVFIELKEDESIGVCFEKGYVVVRTQYETKFVCKGKAFISLWK